MIFADQAPTPGNTPWSWSLPPTMQMGQVWAIIAICVAVRMILTTLPQDFRAKPWGSFTIQSAVLIVGCVMAYFIIPDVHVYAIGTGIISSALAVQFYALALTWLEARIRAVFGLPTEQESIKTIQLGPKQNP